ncbi:MAG: 50S ribosomal protein L18 [Clostridia bacterium]|nr:50S ribosomal protein L18 [Clostridia bacterium]
MISKKNKNADRRIRHERVTEKVFGTTLAPRLNVYRSTKYIYAQIIDDINRVTLCSSSSLALAEQCKGKNKVDSSNLVGQDIAKKAIEKGIKKVVFDRGGYIYTGRVAALADGARKGGLEF